MQTHLTKANFLDYPIDEVFLANMLVRRLLNYARREIWCKGWSNIKELLLAAESVDDLNKTRDDSNRYNQNTNNEPVKGIYLCELHRKQEFKTK